MPHIPCSDEGRLRTVLYEGSADVMFEALTEQLAENCSWMIPWTFCNSRLPYRLGKDRVGFAERLLVSILQSNAVTRPVNIFSETTFLLAFSCSQGLSALLVVSPNSPHSTYDVTIMSTVSWMYALENWHLGKIGVIDRVSGIENPGLFAYVALPWEFMYWWIEYGRHYFER